MAKISPREHRLLRKIAAVIRRDLVTRDESVEALGFRSETSRATIRRILDADRNIGIVTYDKVARALGYRDVIQLFREVD